MLVSFGLEMNIILIVEMPLIEFLKWLYFYQVCDILEFNGIANMHLIEIIH